MSSLWGEMKVTSCMPHSKKQSINSAINSAISQDVKSCRALLPSIDVCSVSRPPIFATLIAKSVYNTRQGRSARRRVIERCSGMQGGEGRGEVSKNAAGVT